MKINLPENAYTSTRRITGNLGRHCLLEFVNSGMYILTHNCIYSCILTHTRPTLMHKRPTLTHNRPTLMHTHTQSWTCMHTRSMHHFTMTNQLIAGNKAWPI